MGVVDPDLYEFLRSNETGLYKNKDDEVIAYVHVNFFDLEDFIKVVGAGHFDEGGINVTLMTDSIAVELNDIIEESLGHNLADYKKCFCEWNEYFPKAED